MIFTIPLMRNKKSALRAPFNKFIPAALAAVTSELLARLQEKQTHLNQPRKGFIYRHNYRIVAVGEENFSTSKRLAKEFGTGKKDWDAHFWVTRPHPKGSNQENTSGAQTRVKLLEEAGASCAFKFHPLSIATSVWLRGKHHDDVESKVPLRFFDSVVYFDPRVDYLTLGRFLVYARMVLTDGGKVHLLSRPTNPKQRTKSVHLTWTLEKLAHDHGMVCSMEITIPWGAQKGNNPYSLVVFTLPVSVPVEDEIEV